MGCLTAQCGRWVETAWSNSQIELIEDPTQEMISVSVDKLRRLLGYQPERGEFLTGLIQNFFQSGQEGDT